MISKIKKWLRSRQRKIALDQSFPDFHPDIKFEFFKNYGYCAAISMLVEMEKILQSLKPKVVMEVGSGISTMLISRNLSSGQKLVSIDQSPDWIHKVSSKVTFPAITYISNSLQDGLDFASLEQLLDVKADLLLIDGPSGKRFSDESLSFFRKRLHSKSVVIVDDTDREENLKAAIDLAGNLGFNYKNFTNDPVYINHRFTILTPP